MKHLEKIAKLGHYKVPQSTHKHVGIELEFSCPIPTLALKEMIVAEHLEQYISVGTDGGHWPGEFRHELRILLKQNSMKVPLQKIGALISSLGARFHPNSGFHVHIDMRSRNAAKAFKNLVLCQDLLFNMAHKLRSESHWCNKVTNLNIDDDDSDHYDAINAVLETIKNTIEIRIRESSTDWKDIYYWTKLVCFIADKAALRSYVSNAKEFVKDMNPPKDLVGYVKSKMNGVRQ